MSNRKKAVSIRLSAVDIDTIKRLADRLGVRDSDVIRCGLKIMMSKFGPLADASVCGTGLIPILMESGSDLLRHFDLDAHRLEAIVNAGAAHSDRVDQDDVRLIAKNAAERSYIKLRLSAAGDSVAVTTGASSGRFVATPSGLEATNSKTEALNRYLLDKYKCREGAPRD